MYAINFYCLPTMCTLYALPIEHIHSMAIHFQYNINMLNRQSVVKVGLLGRQQRAAGPDLCLPLHFSNSHVPLYWFFKLFPGSELVWRTSVTLRQTIWGTSSSTLWNPSALTLYRSRFALRGHSGVAVLWKKTLTEQRLWSQWNINELSFCWVKFKGQG